MAQKHKQFSEELHNQLHQPLVNLKESQRKMVADTSDKVEGAQKEFNAMRVAVPKFKKAYDSKCKELDAAEQENQAAVPPPLYSTPFLNSSLNLNYLFFDLHFQIDSNRKFRRRRRTLRRTSRRLPSSKRKSRPRTYPTSREWRSWRRPESSGRRK